MRVARTGCERSCKISTVKDFLFQTVERQKVNQKHKEKEVMLTDEQGNSDNMESTKGGE